MALAAWGLCLSSFAQKGEGGLTQDFSKLSPKERTKIAMKETKEAEADSSYQSIMRHADTAFQAGRYEEALSDFEQARTLRPYNVYPKVKIQDLQALIKKRDDERAAELPATNTAVSTDVIVPQVYEVVPTMVEPAAVPVSPASSAMDKPLATTAPTPVKVHTDAHSHSVTAPVPDVVKQIPLGPNAIAVPGERVYMEAGAVVTERTVEDDGRIVVYRRVVHPSGQVFLFKDGLPVTQRAWDDRFNQ